MKKATLVVSPPYQNNEIFKENSPLNRDDCLAFFRALKIELAKKGYDLCTQDLTPIRASDLIIYNDMPQKLPSIEDEDKSILLLYESELIRPDNWNLESHKRFSKIFTWHDDFIDHKRYYKFNFTHSGSTDFHKFEQKTGFMTLIAGQHKNPHPYELYSKRLAAIKFYEKNHPGFFDFYGMGWDLYTFRGPKLWRALNKLSFLRTLLSKSWKNYKGKVSSKLETFKRYKFSICFENAHSIPGYITEKIFDSLAAGCVPVYWGAPNITNFVSVNCFIDYRNFQDFDKLHNYLCHMSATEYDNILENIKTYMNSESYRQFTPIYCAREVARWL